MQERYLGDTHDFLKYAFLRHLKCVTNFSIGLNWYLTHPEEVDPKQTNDGEKRFHLTGRGWRKWQEWDQELFDKIKVFEDRSKRYLKHFHKLETLDQTTYFEDPVSIFKREEWHKNALRTFKNCDFVFLDPDNGFEVPSAKGNRVAKYAFYSEVADYYSKGKAVISIQFTNRKVTAIELANDVREKVMSKCDSANPLPVIRGRVSPNILFVPLAPRDKYQQLKDAIYKFAKSSPSMGKKGRRAEIIE